MKQLKLFLFIFVFGILFFVPYNTKALENKVVSCDYQFTNINGEKVELEYKVYSDGTVKNLLLMVLYTQTMVFLGIMLIVFLQFIIMRQNLIVLQ